MRHVRSDMEDMMFSSYKADPDLWFRPELKHAGVDNYQRVLLCADDVLAIMKDPERFLRQDLGKNSL